MPEFDPMALKSKRGLILFLCFFCAVVVHGCLADINRNAAFTSLSGNRCWLGPGTGHYAKSGLQLMKEDEALPGWGTPAPTQAGAESGGESGDAPKTPSQWAADGNYAFGSDSSKSCGYGMVIGCMAWVVVLILMILDVVGVKPKPLCLKVEFIWAALWCFLFFIGFCYFCDEWRRNVACPGTFCEPGVVSHAQAAIAFSFFGILAFAALAVDDFQRVRYGDADGDNTAFSNPYNKQNDAYVGESGGAGYQGQQGDTDVAVM